MTKALATLENDDLELIRLGAALAAACDAAEKAAGDHIEADGRLTRATDGSSRARALADREMAGKIVDAVSDEKWLRIRQIGEARASSPVGFKVKLAALAASEGEDIDRVIDRISEGEFAFASGPIAAGLLRDVQALARSA